MEKAYSNSKVEKRLRAYCKQSGIKINSVLADQFRILMQEMYDLGSYDTYKTMTSFK